MIKCPQCGFEVSDNARFCEECGAAIPQEKECPNCHSKAKPNAKFCMECGYSFSNNAPAEASSSSAASISMGDKNMVAGDVIGKKVVVEKGATIIHNEDETRRLVKCHICNRNMAISESIECPCCGELVCEGCYDRGLTLCSSCKKEAIQGLTIGGNGSPTPGNRISKDIQLNVMRETFGLQLDGSVFRRKYKYEDRIKTFAIPSGITEIAENAFSESGIAAVEIPSSVKIIHDNAFLKCSGLRKVVLRGVPESIGKHVFDGCRNLSEIILPDGWEKKNPDAIVGLGVSLMKSGDTDIDHAEIVKWYRKAADSSLFPNADAMYELGECYRYGNGVEENDEEAVKWYRKAAEHGDVNRQIKFADFCYQKKKNAFCEAKDYAEAVKWYRKAAEQGNAEGQYKLAQLYSWGCSGVEKDYVEAVRWYRKAADQKYRGSYLDFLSRYSKYSTKYKENPEVVLPLLKEATDLINAVDQGNVDAMIKLGKCFRVGIAQRVDGMITYSEVGMSQDDTEAAKMFWKAAKHGSDEALDWLCKCYNWHGEGVDKSDPLYAKYEERKKEKARQKESEADTKKVLKVLGITALVVLAVAVGWLAILGVIKWWGWSEVGMIVFCIFDIMVIFGHPLVGIILLVIVLAFFGIIL